MRIALSVMMCAAFLFTTAKCAEPGRILGVAHMGLLVSDIEKSRAFYCGFLGYQEAFSVKNADGTLSLTFIKINDDQYIELFPRLKPEEDRLAHVALYTDDAEALRRRLAARGIAVPERVAKVKIGTLNFTITDPDGHRLEFVEYADGSWPARDRGKFMGASGISPRLRHVGILVGNLDAAMKFYRDLLGFRETWRGASADTLSWVNIRLPDGDDYIEFMLYKDLPAANRRGTQHHMCLETADLAKALAVLQERPGRPERPLEGVRVGKNRKHLSNLFDPDGTRVELMEPGTIDGVPTPSSTAPPPR